MTTIPLKDRRRLMIPRWQLFVTCCAFCANADDKVKLLKEFNRQPQKTPYVIATLPNQVQRNLQISQFLRLNIVWSVWRCAAVFRASDFDQAAQSSTLVVGYRPLSRRGFACLQSLTFHLKTGEVWHVANQKVCAQLGSFNCQIWHLLLSLKVTYNRPMMLTRQQDLS